MFPATFLQKRKRSDLARERERKTSMACLRIYVYGEAKKYEEEELERIQCAFPCTRPGDGFWRRTKAGKGVLFHLAEATLTEEQQAWLNTYAYGYEVWQEGEVCYFCGWPFYEPPGGACGICGISDPDTTYRIPVTLPRSQFLEAQSVGSLRGTTISTFLRHVGILIGRLHAAGLVAEAEVKLQMGEEIGQNFYSQEKERAEVEITSEEYAALQVLATQWEMPLVVNH